jgi:hypothetical protein
LEVELDYNNNNSGITPGLARSGQPELFVATVGFVALTLGILVYLFDRPATAVYFVPDSWRLAATPHLLFGVLGNYLPAFMHALAFSLFINAIAGRRYVGLMCASWFMAEVSFEVAQTDSVAFRIADILPDWFARLPILENISSHFLTGRFDVMDVLFLMFGCATAYAIGYLVLPPRHRDLPRPRLTASRKARLAGLLLVALVGLTSIVSSGGTGGSSTVALAVVQ